MNVVCDTSALIALSRINALGLLKQQFARLIIPDAVYEEIIRWKNKSGIKEIALAKEIGADFVVLDDAHARKIAEAEGLKVVGLLAVLVDAKKRGLIADIRPLLDELKRKGFFIEEDLYRLLLAKAGE